MTFSKLCDYNKLNNCLTNKGEIKLAKNCACVLDFGSGKLTAVIAERGVNNTFNIHGTGEVEYAGFYQNEFVEPENLAGSIEEVLTKVQSASGKQIDKLFVGVPAEFSYCKTKSGGVAFKKRTKIGQDEIMAFFNIVSEGLSDEDSTIINRSPIYFTLDDNKKCMNPKGQVSTKLAGEISFIFAENYFIDNVSQILKNFGIENVEYVSSPLAEAIYLIDPEVRDTGAIIIDCGFISTHVALVKGDGLVGLNTFSVGGGHVTTDLSQILELGFKDAENLKRKIVLSLDAKDDDFYEIVSSNGIATPVSAKLTNEIALARIDMIAGLISRSLTILKSNNNGFLPVYLTGGGICYLKGGRDYLSKSIGTNIEILSPQVPQLNRPHFSSVLGILDLVLSQMESQKISFKDKLRRLFKK